MGRIEKISPSPELAELAAKGSAARAIRSSRPPAASHPLEAIFSKTSTSARTTRAEQSSILAAVSCERSRAVR